MVQITNHAIRICDLIHPRHHLGDILAISALPFQTASDWQFSAKPKGISKRMVFNMASSLNLKQLGILVPVYFGTCLGVSAQRGIKTEGFQNGKFLSFDNWDVGARLFWYPFVFPQIL